MILLTGASGFIGQHLLKALIQKYGVDNVVAFTSSPIQGVNFILHNNYNFDEDILERNGLGQIHTIIHAASFTPKSGSDSNNLLMCESNVLNTRKVVNLKAPNLKKFLFLSTLDVYKNIDGIISESTAILPQSLYGYSKYYCEGLVKTRAKELGIDNCILRVGHVYGPGEYQYKKLIPEVMKAILSCQNVNVWGEGSDIRSFIYIDDVVSAIMAAIEIDSVESPVNIVSDKGYSILDIVNRIIRISRASIELKHIPSDHVPRNLLFDNTLMKSILHEPRVSIDEGLMKEWMGFKSRYEERSI